MEKLQEDIRKHIESLQRIQQECQATVDLEEARTRLIDEIILALVRLRVGFESRGSQNPAAGEAAVSCQNTENMDEGMASGETDLTPLESFSIPGIRKKEFVINGENKGDDRLLSLQKMYDEAGPDMTIALVTKVKSTVDAIHGKGLSLTDWESGCLHCFLNEKQESCNPLDGGRLRSCAECASAGQVCAVRADCNPEPDLESDEGVPHGVSLD